ncbi:hypothetical protein ACFTSD_01480 [Nocardiaceae bacterium NPDC056970]
MDALGSLTAITAGVMRRMADAIDNAQADETRQEMHFHFHIHSEPGQADNLEKSEGKGKGLFNR